MEETISDNIINSISEIAEHDKATIETYIEICWEDLERMLYRFKIYECKTIQDIEIRMNLECVTSDFTHIYLVAEDGTIYTDKFVTYVPGDNTLNRSIDLMSYFEDGAEKLLPGLMIRLQEDG